MPRQKGKDTTPEKVIPDVKFKQLPFTLIDGQQHVFLHNLLDPPDLNKQLAAVKQVTVWLQNGENLEKSSLPANVIELLVHLYYKAGSKCPLRRLIACSLQVIAQQELIKNHLTSQAMGFIKNTNELLSPCGRHIVDIISSLLENFLLGEDVMISLYQEGLAFLISTLKQHLSTLLSVQENPADQSVMMQECLVVLRVFNKLLQKSSAQIEENITREQADCDEGSKKIALAITPIVIILKNESFLLDCRVASGMAFSLIIKILTGSNAIWKIMEYLFPAVVCQRLSLPVLDIYVSEETFSGVSQCSLLCILNGVLAMFDVPELLTEINSQHLFITDFLAPFILGMLPSIQEPNSKLIMSRSIVLLSKKTSEILEQSSRTTQSHLFKKLGGDSNLIHQLVKYSWNNWEDPIDIVRHQARSIFENTIKCHLLASGEDADTSQFLRQLIQSLLVLEWNTKGKYGPLSCLVKYMGSSEITRITPDMPNQLLEVIGEQSLTTYVSELYVKLSDSSMTELQRLGQDDCPKAWLQQYISPVITVLCTKSRTQKLHTMEYIVPALMKQCPQTLQYILNQLTMTDKDDENAEKLGALITCLKLARTLKLLKPASLQHVAGSENLWGGVICEETIRQALCHPADQMRLDAFGLICEQQKTTEPLQEEDLVLVKFFLQYNMRSQEPAFRQQMAATIKKLLIRLRDSGRALLRNHAEAVRKGKEASDFMETWTSSQKFMTWLLSHLFDFLYPGAGFPGRTTALTILSLLMEIMTKEEPQDELEYDLLSQIHAHHVQSLVECLRDTFESNKIDACNILLQIPSNHISKCDQEIRDLLSTALELASSCHPQDGTTAAFLIKYLIHLPNIGDHISHELKQKDRTVKPLSDKRAEIEYNSLLALELLKERLEEQLLVAKKSLLHAAATKPVYPMLQCVRYLLTDVKLRDVTDTEHWRCLLGDFIQLCLEIAVVVSPGVNNASPEGNVPTDSIIGPGLALEGLVSDRSDLDSLQESATKVTLMPEYLIVCCWRCIKEVSLLLGQITKTAPITYPGSEKQNGLLNINQIHIIGQYFNTQLLESRHRGAFELAYAGFVKMTTMLWKSPDPDVYKLPKLWLEEILHDIKSQDPSSRLCSTRRSAGVPFYVQALVSTTTSASGKQCFQWVIRDLLGLASVHTVEGDQEETARVHSLNILRALYKDTRLADDVFPFIAEGVKVSIMGYGSKFWAIRNSSTLLFSALINRMFGVKKGKDDQAKRNCLSGRVFFNRFPFLYDFLLRTLEEATVNIGSSGVYHLHPGLYPTLMVLGRLYPSVVESVDTTSNLSAFIPYVIRCAFTPVHKTRMMAARAIRPLVSHGQYESVITSLISVMGEPGQLISQNYIHGALVQLTYLLKDLVDLPVSSQSAVASILVPFLLNISQTKLCFTTKSVLSQVTLTVNCHAWPITNGNIEEGLAQLKQTHHFCGGFGNDEPSSMWMPSVSEFYENRAKYVLALAHHENDERKYLQDTLLAVLSSKMYEVRLQGLVYLNDLFANSNDSKAHPCAAALAPELHTSAVIFSVLVTALMYTEQHDECMELILQTLPMMAMTNRLPWKCQDDVFASEKVWYRMISLLDHRRDEVKCRAIEFIGCLVAPIFQQAQQGDKKSITYLKDWCDTLTNRASIEQSLDMRLACSKALATNILLLGPDAHCVLGDSTHTLWTVGMKLLQDEDGEVRKKMASAIKNLQHEYSHILSDGHTDVLPEVALVIMTRTYLNLYKSVDEVGCAKSLFNWIEEEMEPGLNNEDLVVRLFDRGEMNTYKDDLQFIDMIATVAKSVLSGSLSEKLSGFLTLKVKNVIQWLQKRCEKWENITAKSPFIKDQDEDFYDDIMFDVCRRLVAVDLLSYLGTVSDNDKKKLHFLHKHLMQLHCNRSMNALLFRKNSVY